MAQRALTKHKKGRKLTARTSKKSTSDEGTKSPLAKNARNGARVVSGAHSSASGKQFLSDKVGHFTESVIREMTRQAMLHGAVNLAQGFPDFPAPGAPYACDTDGNVTELLGTTGDAVSCEMTGLSPGVYYWRARWIVRPRGIVDAGLARPVEARAHRVRREADAAEGALVDDRHLREAVVRSRG